MIIKIHRGIWHRDCPENKWNSGICKEIEHDKEKTLIECLHCGQKGRIPKGTPFQSEICIEDA
jgi:hypothetical protein